MKSCWCLTAGVSPTTTFNLCEILMDGKPAIRMMKPGEEDQISKLAWEVFTEFVSPDFPAEGIKEMKRYLSPDLLAERLRSDHFVLLGESDSQLLGVIEVKDFIHVTLLFVAGESQRRGIGRQLLAEALKICRRNRPGLSEVTVNSLPNAVEAYEVLGFHAKGPEEEERGIRFIPMKLVLRMGDEG